MSASLYHSGTGTQAPHCMHVIGVGPTGAAYVEALLRTGEIEDHLADPRATFAAMVVDIGEEAMGLAKDYAASFIKRLESRGIPTDRFLFQAIPLPVPSKEELFEGMNRTREFLKLEYPRYYWNPNFESYVSKKAEIPALGAAHFPRAVAKAIYANAYYAGERPMDVALRGFVAQVEKAALPSMITVCFGMGNGVGSGMVVDLARHLSNIKLGRRIPVIGVGQLPHEGDSEPSCKGATLYTTLNDLDCMLDDDKNAGVTMVWGDLYRSPFTGGFFAVAAEQSWQRLSAYTTTGQPEKRLEFKQMVTNRFVADSFMRFAVVDNGRDLFRALRPSGLTGAPHETVSAKSRNWTLFDAAKFTHPGVQVLPGEAPSKWEDVISQWIDFIPQYAGLVDGFKTDYAEMSLYTSRNMNADSITASLKSMMKKNYMLDEDSTLLTSNHEFFDTLTAYANIILPGVAKTDLVAFWEAQKTYDTLSWEEKLLEHAWLIDLGPMLSEPAIRFEGMAGECFWGCACWVVVPYEELRGTKLPPANRKIIVEQGIAAMTKTVVPTPGGLAPVKKPAKIEELQPAE